ncbi:hypothetical protein [Hymenobacter arizonensis]|uniref:Uncharacterized protein n=1 Tax=Hymenobacter arizonensis TaxID=1227077 RepID=A0A1I5U435_HYMAR|nr:hypothetical protein [Hymenobacter arizonensis]SFP90010.1 hypothetical protein SAMN04515668_0753 [Hymenobacter arizonensis]
MPKLIDYPRTTYAGAWELSEIVDDTGGKCAIETAARKLNRKVSGSFKAIIGSAVKFGLLTSKRDLLTTTTLFKRIKHAYDKQEELIFHREAFLTPPLFTQICRKFRSRELPVQMLDVMLIREFGVEEINAQGVAKAFIEGCRMVGLLDERNIVADIDALANRPNPRRELASPAPNVNTFRSSGFQNSEAQRPEHNGTSGMSDLDTQEQFGEEMAALENEATPVTSQVNVKPTASALPRHNSHDAIASLFGLHDSSEQINPEAPREVRNQPEPAVRPEQLHSSVQAPAVAPVLQTSPPIENLSSNVMTYQLQMSGPGVNTTLTIVDEDDIAIAIALLQKIKRQLKS